MSQELEELRHLISVQADNVRRLRERAELAESRLSSSHAARAAAEADARRYRWLREQNTVPYGRDTFGEVQNIIVFWDGPQELDAAIDAALRPPAPAGGGGGEETR